MGKRFEMSEPIFPDECKGDLPLRFLDFSLSFLDFLVFLGSGVVAAPAAAPVTLRPASRVRSPLSAARIS